MTTTALATSGVTEPPAPDAAADYVAVLTAIRAALWDLSPVADPSGLQAQSAMGLIIELRAILDHHAAVGAATLDRLGVARESAGRTAKLLMTMGAAPAVAHRWLRIGTALPRLQRLPGYTADGAVSGEHADAIVTGIGHVEHRAPDGLCREEELEVERMLIGQAMSGATPAEIGKKARDLGNEYAAETGGLPAAEDRGINELALTKTPDGRLSVKADLDAVIGEKLTAAIESLNMPRPEPDGSPDARTAGARNADALEIILDAAAVADSSLVTPPKTFVYLTLPATAPEKAGLDWLGPITATTAKLLACDSTVTEVVIDGETVPLQMGTKERLFTPAQRRAIIIRDVCCIKCGAPAGHTQCHHIVWWSEGGLTDLDNGCLLCTSCHTQIHNTDWDITMGADGHPWLVPPASVDPRRRPLPAYNRRTMTLDDRIAA
ncbi:DUF222 domain-containing protein [Gordonia sp. NPDC003424]